MTSHRGKMTEIRLEDRLEIQMGVHLVMCLEWKKGLHLVMNLERKMGPHLAKQIETN